MRSSARRLVAIVPLTVLSLAGCSGYGTSQATATPSPAATSAFQVKVGECFNVPDDGTTESVTRVEKVACSEPHTFEAFKSSKLTTYDSFPGTKAIKTEATGACTDAFQEFAGDTPRASIFQLKWFVPDEESWVRGDREILCLVTPDEDGVQTTGSAASGGGTAVTPSPTAS